MTSSDQRDSPYKSPGMDDADLVRRVYGDAIVRCFRHLRWAYIAIALQLGLFACVPVLAGLTNLLPDEELGKQIFSYSSSILLGLIYLFSVWCMFRLLRSLENAHWHDYIFFLIWAAIPCLGLFGMLSVVGTIREHFEAHGIPFGHFGPNWKALREMAANVEAQQLQ